MFRYDGGTSFQELTPAGDGGSTTINKELVRAGGQGGGIGSVLYSDESMAATPGPIEYFVYDALGNTTALTGATGTPTQTNVYKAFGDTVVHTGTSDNNRLRNTKERDASIGLDDDGMRMLRREMMVYSGLLNHLPQINRLGLSGGLQLSRAIASGFSNHLTQTRGSL